MKANLDQLREHSPNKNDISILQRTNKNIWTSSVLHGRKADPLEDLKFLFK